MRWLVAAFRPHVRALVRDELLLVVATALSLGSSAVMARAMDVYVPAGDRTALAAAAVGYAGTVLAAAGLTWKSRVGVEATAQAVMRGVKERLFAHLVAHDLALHDQQGAGRLLSRVQGDTEALRMLLSEVVLQAGPDVALFVGSLGILARTAPRLGAVVAAAVPLYAVIFFLFRRVSPPLFTASRELAARVSGLMAEVLRALPMLRSYERVDWMLDRAARLTEEKRAAEARAGMSTVWFFNSLFAVRALAYAVVLWVGAAGVADGSLTLGGLLLALDYLRKMFEPFLRLQFHVVTFEKARAGERRIRELLALTPRIRAPDSPSSWPGLGDGLRLEDVHLAYVPGVPVLAGLSLEFPARRHTALVGPTGGGKSTVLQLLFRFRDPDAGRITVGGLDVRALDPVVHRAHLGLVLQDVHVLPGTIAENLGVDPGDAASLLARVGLHGLSPETRVGEGGRTLSRGEAQLLCFARAIAAEPEVVVLDEATSAMDPATEARIQAVLAAQPVTRITVAHRLRTVRDADQICVIEAGACVERGTHDELLARRGRYAALWQAQLAAEGA